MKGSKVLRSLSSLSNIFSAVPFLRPSSKSAEKTSKNDEKKRSLRKSRNQSLASAHRARKTTAMNSISSISKRGSSSYSPSRSKSKSTLTLQCDLDEYERLCDNIYERKQRTPSNTKTKEMEKSKLRKTRTVDEFGSFDSEIEENSLFDDFSWVNPELYSEHC